MHFVATDFNHFSQSITTILSIPRNEGSPQAARQLLAILPEESLAEIPRSYRDDKNAQTIFDKGVRMKYFLF